jgi:Flp pilus assembly protein TadB
MASTRRRRQTKHRGNAAGVIESRGRTGRKPTTAEKKGPAEVAKQKAKPDRRDKPPTWRGAFYRALAAAALLLVAMIVLTGKPALALIYFVVVLVLYVPLSYYTDAWIYNRRMRKKAAEGKAKAR